ncbi:hypothetical protein ACFY3M_50260 [Streptomyces mirabilis]|uniref:hypothetical protein n=1 Tax=Streptomyces mirabilis TaxID=68239 RepID=UPI0036BB1A8A
MEQLGSSLGMITAGASGRARWDLAIDPAERAALTEVLSACPNSPVEVTLAR